MICPRCGTDNPPGVGWCRLCQLTLDKMQGMPQPANAGERIYEKAVEAPRFEQSTQVPSDPYYSARMQARVSSPPAGEEISKTRSNTNLAVLVGFLAGTLIITVMAIVLFAFVWRIPNIKVSTPPGWSASGEMTLDYYRSLAASNGQDLVYYSVFRDQAGDNTIAVGRGTRKAAEKPRSEDHDAVESFFWEQKPEWEEHFATLFAQDGVSYQQVTFEVVEMACGDTALHMCYYCQDEKRQYTFNFLAIYKKGYQYFTDITTEGRNTGQEEVDYVLENLSFD
jgi:hypothetical protein